MQRKSMLILVWVVAAVVLMSMHQLSPLTMQIPTSDSAIFLTCAKWMNDGMVMYRDIFDHKGIFIYLFDLLGMSIGGLTGVWMMCVFFVVASTRFVYKTCRLFASCNISTLVSMMFLLMTTRTGTDNTVELVALPFITSSAWVMIRAIKSNMRLCNWEIMLFAISFAVVALLKPNITISIDLLALALLYQVIKGKEWKTIARYAVVALCGVLIVVIPVFTYLGLNDAIDDFLSTFWFFNFEYSAWAPVHDKWLNFGQLLFVYIPSLFAWIFIIVAVVKEWKSKYIWFLLLLYVLTAYGNAGLSGLRFGHYFVPVYPFAAILMARSFEGLYANKYMRWSAYGVCGLFVCYCLNYVRMDYNYMRENTAKYEKVNTLALYVDKHVPETETIAVYGIDANVFVKSNRKSATKYIYQSPVFSVRPSMKDEYRDDIITQKPTLLLIRKSSDFPCMAVLSSYSIVEAGFEGIDVYKLR